MKRPWLSVVVFLAVFSGIIAFCVIFGGYSSLYRAQNRTNEAKRLMTVECQKKLDLVPEIISMAEKTQAPMDPVLLARMDETAKEAKSILTRMDATFPLEPELIAAFEKSQVRTAQDITGLILGIKEDDALRTMPAFLALEKKFKDLETTVSFNCNRYNNEARYFNARKTTFHMAYIAKLFGFDQLYFPEITASLVPPQA